MPLDKETIASRDQSRKLIILSVWAVVLLGLPLWWKTTRIYRAELPYKGIREWNEWKTCQPTFPIKVNLHLSNSASLKKIDTEIKEGVERRVEELNAGYISKAKLPAHFIIDQSWSGSKESDISDQFSTIPGTYDFYISPGNVTSAIIKTQRQGFIQVESWDEDHIISAVTETYKTIFGAERKTIQQLVNAADSRGVEKVKDQLKAVKYAPGYQLTFSLFSGDASNGVREWKIQEAINAYLTPILKSMSVVSTFTVESQVQHYASLTFTPQLDSDNNEYYLTPDLLPNFINAAEWSLASTVTSLPSLNFLTFVPKPSESPLTIKSGPSSPRSKTNSFLIPRWGGIAILNRDNNTQQVITEQELEPLMKVFLTQLRDLMGLTDLSAAKASFPIVFHKSSIEAPTTWELDNLLRRRTTENLVDSLAALTSLARLVADTPNMVVLDHIQKDVVDALKDVERSCQRLSGQQYLEALAASRDALVKAETAFFDPTMVSMLYFPNEHRAAIYMPLFVPISVPLLMALLREVKKNREKKKALAEKAEDKETDKVKTE
ncbi:GPI transamidase component [Mortierella sp. AM989]|nr:GPI transamidase component [Mortierella sp. AM989]